MSPVQSPALPPATSLPPVSDLTAHLGFWLRLVSNHVSHAFAAKLAATEVTVAEWSLMRALYDKAPMPPSRIADDMGLTRGAITKLADRLIAKALIVRAASPDDGRAQTLALTERGTALVPALAALADRNDAEFFDALTPDERASLLRLLKGLAERGQMTATPIE
ncbi:MAG: MarR family transcriptional regulator [Rhizobiales bacterium 24-66-13]|jgi:DNA-binding MarR family transcriptional regulator|nr:MAG: MarR family transcriptional regulator [Rhizobiales bacterium 35-66-30]OYZ75165.1 MAG: MarR family transcriptional regulator [Rhizobiales bacterium 24-66-13]OZB03767.1 MAG: MarR family transcriptional regulator [Rhizobiales bacterium 39-66-18]HQS10558.1 MarR family transcriptional regulator [Xanthobacteraceae bacterium]HQS48078.1 MarR family transcriptional regulator [Xanthobacteraceae bacterium]